MNNTNCTNKIKEKEINRTKRGGGSFLGCISPRPDPFVPLILLARLTPKTLTLALWEREGGRRAVGDGYGDSWQLLATKRPVYNQNPNPCPARVCERVRGEIEQLASNAGNSKDDGNDGVEVAGNVKTGAKLEPCTQPTSSTLLRPEISVVCSRR